MNKSKKITKPRKQNLTDIANKIKKFVWLIVLIFFFIIYGFVLLKINNFQTQQPSTLVVNSDLKTTPQPAINPSVVKQLETLKNNSVSVQALFNQARQNPFQ